MRFDQLAAFKPDQDEGEQAENQQQPGATAGFFLNRFFHATARRLAVARVVTMKKNNSPTSERGGEREMVGPRGDVRAFAVGVGAHGEFAEF